jgi:hypothetical protein
MHSKIHNIVGRLLLETKRGRRKRMKAAWMNKIGKDYK